MKFEVVLKVGLPGLCETEQETESITIKHSVLLRRFNGLPHPGRRENISPVQTLPGRLNNPANIGLISTSARAFGRRKVQISRNWPIFPLLKPNEVK
jgi:hypothetical protein